MVTATIDIFSVVGREGQNHQRINFIRLNSPSLNKNICKYHLFHSWDEVLFNTSELKLKVTHLVQCGYSICHFGVISAYMVSALCCLTSCHSVCSTFLPKVLTQYNQIQLAFAQWPFYLPQLALHLPTQLHKAFTICYSA